MSPLLNKEDLAPPPPLVAPPLRNTSHETVLAHKDSVVSKWSPSDDAAFPLISFNWSDNISPMITTSDQAYLDAVDLEFSISNVWDVALAGDRLNSTSGEARIAERHIRDIILRTRSKVVEGLKKLQLSDSYMVRPIIDYRTRGVIPVYRGSEPPSPRVRGSPYKHSQSVGIIGKVRNDVRNGRILVRSARTVTEYDSMV